MVLQVDLLVRNEAFDLQSWPLVHGGERAGISRAGGARRSLESFLQGPFIPHAFPLPRGLRRAHRWDGPGKISSIWSYSWRGSTLGYGISSSFVGVVLFLFGNTLSLLSDLIGRFGSLRNTRRKLQCSPGAKRSLLKGTISQISEEEAVNTPPLLNNNNRAG